MTQQPNDSEARREIIAAVANEYYDQLKNQAPYINMTFEQVGAVCRDLATQDVDAFIQDEILKAQTNAVAWTVGEIDKIHFRTTGDDDDNDSVFKGIKNTLRIHYEAKTGIDPAPSYPVKAQLNQPNTNKENN